MEFWPPLIVRLWLRVQRRNLSSQQVCLETRRSPIADEHCSALAAKSEPVGSPLGYRLTGRSLVLQAPRSRDKGSTCVKGRSRIRGKG